MKDLARETGGIVLPMLFLGPDMMKTAGEKERMTRLLKQALDSL